MANSQQYNRKALYMIPKRDVEQKQARHANDEGLNKHDHYQS